jgi:hypothetical protein
LDTPVSNFQNRLKSIIFLVLSLQEALLSLSVTHMGETVGWTDGWLAVVILIYLGCIKYVRVRKHAMQTLELGQFYFHIWVIVLIIENNILLLHSDFL